MRRFTQAYADYALFENFALPGGEYAAWFSVGRAFRAHSGGVFLMPVPRRALPSRRWQIVGWATALGAVSFAFGEAFKPGRSYTHPYVENPFGGWES